MRLNLNAEPWLTSVLHISTHLYPIAGKSSMLEMMIRVLLIRIGPQNYQVRHVFYSYVFFWTRPLNHFFCENLTQLNSDFGKLRTSAFTWYTLDTSDMIFNLRKMRLRLHSFGPFWTNSTENQWEISELGRFSCFIDFFVIFHIVIYIRLCSFHFFRHHLTTFTLIFGTRSCTPAS